MTRKLRPYDEPPAQQRSLVPNGPDSAATSALVVSALWLVAAAGIGALAALQRLFPGVITASLDVPLGSGVTLVLDAPTVQAAFVDALVFGWLSNAAFAAICFATPRLLGVRLAGDAIANLGLGAWNVAVAAGIGLLYVKGVSGTGALAEFPLPVKALELLALLAVNLAFWRTVLTTRGRVYISLYYFGIALLALLALVAIDTLPGVVGLGATNEQLVYAFAARALETYWVLGTALGTLYYVIPRVTRNPLYSGGLATLAWAGWVVFAGLSAVGALVDPSVPYAITSIGQAGTLLLLAPTLLAVANLLGTIGGRWSMLLSPGTLAFAVVGLAVISGSAVLESVGSLHGVQTLTRGTEWPTGVMVISLLGGATFAFYAFADHALPRVLRRAWSQPFLAGAQLWTTFVGVALGGLAMIGSGLVAGSLQAQAATADAINAEPLVVIFRFVAAAGLGLAALGGLSLLVNLFLMYTAGSPAEFVASEATAPPGAPSTSAAAGH
jgi:cytochrome c oxidase cbb3-type subunit 1